DVDDDDDGSWCCYRLRMGTREERRRRVVASDTWDRIDRSEESIFGFAGDTRRKSLPVAAVWWWPAGVECAVFERYVIDLAAFTAVFELATLACLAVLTDTKPDFISTALGTMFILAHG
nr:hypothetical protein [Tanacetum cinerariifolium]